MELRFKGMKKIGLGALVIMVAICSVSCGSDNEQSKLSPDLVNNPVTASSQKSEVPLSKMVFTETVQNFGAIVQGETKKLVYRFKNESEVDLIISSATGSCGCTVPQWPKRPIKPGQESEITVVFNSKGKKGKQNKKVYITANTSPINNVIVLKGEVVAPE